MVNNNKNNNKNIIAFFPLCSMHMLPKSQDSGFYKHQADSKFHIDYTMVDTPRPEDVSEGGNCYSTCMFICMHVKTVAYHIIHRGKFSKCDILVDSNKTIFHGLWACYTLTSTTCAVASRMTTRYGYR